MSDNVVIFACPGIGSNHLANLIATSGRYHYPVDYDRYNTETKSNAHFLIKTKAKKNIATYHFSNADDRAIEDFCSSGLTKFIVIHFPIHNQLAKTRIQAANGFDLDCPFVRDLEKIYKQQFLNKIYAGDWFTLMADDLFSEDVDKLIDSIELILGHDLGHKTLIAHIHAKWISRLQQHPAPF